MTQGHDTPLPQQTLHHYSNQAFWTAQSFIQLHPTTCDCGEPRCFFLFPIPGCLICLWNFVCTCSKHLCISMSRWLSVSTCMCQCDGNIFQLCGSRRRGTPSFSGSHTQTKTHLLPPDKHHQCIKSSCLSESWKNNIKKFPLQTPA